MPAGPSVLFVCLGNICRSPLAEAAMRQQAQRIGLAVDVDSAGPGSRPQKWRRHQRLPGASGPQG